jgi:hypothetical protein
MVQGLDIGAANVHTRAAADGLQPFEYLDIFSLVGFGLFLCCHELPPNNDF